VALSGARDTAAVGSAGEDEDDHGRVLWRKKLNELRC
jgi:hypothetical protein